MKTPKIVIIGAGSLFFGRQAIWAAANLPGFRGCTLCLVDIDSERLDKLTRLAHLATASAGVHIESTDDYREALPGADFVVLSFSKDNTHYRRIECEVGAKYGIRSCSGDTIGPAGLFHAMREFPAILEIAHAVEELCPEAWVINYVNPSAAMGIGLMRHAKVKSLALCDTHHMPGKKESYLQLIGEDLSKIDRFDMRIAGVNHFTWMLKAELEGRDVLPDIREAFRRDAVGEVDEGYAKGRFNNYITAQLADLFGAVPTCTGHTKEYVPFYQGRSPIQEKIPPLAVFDCDERERWTSRVWQEIDDFLSGKKPISEFHSSIKSDHATDVIHTMVVEDGRNYFINRPNSDCVTGGRPVDNLPADAFLELECRLDRNGPRPLKVGSFPLGLRSLQYLILDIHELTIEAIMKRDRELLVRALSMDPLVNSIATARVVIDELFEREKEVLPGWPETDVKEAVAEMELSDSSKKSSLQLY
ncbi:MAG: glycoside hydrolase family 4 [Verrucomicrobia bacterium Tous-C9LFEB]|nr:MAG: glycoside hydrolase family 4 [Verrucomicrobia bacterium Tous-C9LFEB]